MTDIFSITYDNVDGLAAAAFAKSRMFAIAIREDLLPNLQGDDLTLAEYLHVRIIQRRIFDEDILDMLDALGERLEQLVLDGTQAVKRVDADECNVSPASWTEHRRTQAADQIGRAALFLIEIETALYAVHDMLHAERAVSELRKAS